ncbi:MAG: hypothetical protein Alpg2KO_12880 [Alphaproteobacteria bacterium]
MHIRPLTLQSAASCCQFLEGCHDYSPANAGLTYALGQFVARLGACPVDCPALSDPAMRELEQKMPPLCGRAEAEMEKSWAEALLARPILHRQTLRLFWYHQHYLNLVEDELDLMAEHTDYPERLVFLGSGALPLTAIMAAEVLPECQVVCVDLDQQANALARALFERLDVPIEVVTAAAQDVAMSPDDLPIMASLLSTKHDMFGHFSRMGVRRFILRDAEGPYRLLYQPAPIPDPSEYVALARTDLSHDRINTSILYQQPED